MAPGKRGDRNRPGHAAHRGNRQHRLAHRRGGTGRGCRADAVGGRDPAPPPGRRRGGPRGDPPALPLPGPAPRTAAAQHRPALENHLQHAPAHDRQGVQRVPDPDPDQQLARRRARLPRAQPRAPRQILCPAPGAAALQAAPDGLGIRPLFPDRPLLPRRGRPGRPLPRRVLRTRSSPRSRT